MFFGAKKAVLLRVAIFSCAMFAVGAHFVVRAKAEELTPAAQAKPVEQTAVQKREKQIKAAFMFNFLKFVEWPESMQNASTICFLEENTFGDALTPLTKKEVRGKPIKIKENITLNNISQCSILYVDPKFEESLDTMLLDIYIYPILTISDMRHFAFKGGVLGFYREKKRIRFAINTSRAERLGLKLSSKLLELAKVVQ